ncbi:MAG: PD40 domain-containing protein [Bacteroidia bacterium]|nr:PD40 domain-containing protein [Bacteroidia bacterium]
MITPLKGNVDLVLKSGSYFLMRIIKNDILAFMIIENVLSRTGLIITVFIINFSFAAYAQKNLEKGDKFYELGKYAEAIQYYQKEINSNDAQVKLEAQTKLAQCYLVTNDFENALDHCETVYRVNKRDPETILNYGLALKCVARFTDAKKIFWKYARANPDDPRGQLLAQSCDSALKWYQPEYDVEVREVQSLNTAQSDFAPVYYDNGIVFSSSRSESEKSILSINSRNGNIFLDLYYADLTKTLSTDGPLYLEKLNSDLQEGAATISSDGKEIYFTRMIGNDKRKAGKLQVFYTKKDIKGNWSEAQSAFKFNSNKYNVAYPSLSRDGKRIFFSCDMYGGYGGMDIYMCYKKNNEWGDPLNLGKVINTFGDEVYPYCHFDNKTIYFASDGHPGLGGLDIFSSEEKEKRKWSNPKNLRPPINTIGIEFGLIMDEAELKGFFSSNRMNGTGSDDLYSFKKNTIMRIDYSNEEFIIKDESLYDGVSVTLLDEEFNKSETVSSTNGYFTFKIDPNIPYSLIIRKDDFSHNKISLIYKDKEEALTLEISPKKLPVIFNDVEMKVGEVHLIRNEKTK